MAWEDLRRAADAYTQAWDAIARGEKPDIVTTLRRISERVSLAAARAAKSCSAGQQKLTVAPRSPDNVATGIGRRESGWTWGDRVSWKGQTWTVRDVRADGTVDIVREGSDLADTAPASELRRAKAAAPAPAVSMQPVWPPAAAPLPVPTTPRPTRTRKPKAPAVDPAKDQLLVNAFADAIKQAAQSMGAS